MKKLLFGLLANLYLVQVLLFISVTFNSYKFLIIPGLFIISATVLAFVNIGYPILNVKKIILDNKKQDSINRRVFMFKILAIPFYTLNYFLWTFLTGMFILMPGNVIFLFFVLPLGIGFAYLILIASSSYTIVLLYALRKNGKISKKQFIIHLICQLVFVVDVIDQILILKFTKRDKD